MIGDRMSCRFEYERAPVRCYLNSVDRQVMAGGDHLSLHYGVTGSQGLKAISGSHPGTMRDANVRGNTNKIFRTQRSVESNLHLPWPRSPNRNWLRALAIGIADLKQFTCSGRSRSPVGATTMGGNNQIPLRRDASVGGKRVQAGQEVVLRLHIQPVS